MLDSFHKHLGVLNIWPMFLNNSYTAQFTNTLWHIIFVCTYINVSYTFYFFFIRIHMLLLLLKKREGTKKMTVRKVMYWSIEFIGNFYCLYYIHIYIYIKQSLTCDDSWMLVSRNVIMCMCVYFVIINKHIVSSCRKWFAVLYNFWTSWSPSLNHIR